MMLQGRPLLVITRDIASFIRVKLNLHLSMVVSGSPKRW